MTKYLTDEQNQVILQALNDIINNAPWDDSNFLKHIRKSIVAIRDDFLAQLASCSPEESKAVLDLTHRAMARTGLQEVYISLYSSDGNTLHSWEKIVSNLPSQIISRPIYASEKDIIEWIKTKENRVNEAYLAIFIKQDDILHVSTDKPAIDKLGTPLLSLKNNALDLDNASRFVHISGVYQFDRGHLRKI